MLRSLMTAVTGVRSHQVMLDVTGNNIANVNTTGFKKDFTIFQDLLYQTSQGASGPGDARGGINPAQVGLGVKVGAIETIHTQGNSQYTGNKTDMMISGEGYFVFRSGTGKIYSRAGNFTLDSDKKLVHSGTGYVVQGYEMERNPLNALEYIKAADISDIVIPIGKEMEARATTVVGIKNNLDAAQDPYLPIGYADIAYNDIIGNAKVKIDGIEYSVGFKTDLDSADGRGYLTVTFDATGAASPPSIVFDMVGVDDGGTPVLQPRAKTLTLNGSTPPTVVNVSYDKDSGKMALLGAGATNAGSTLWEINLKENMSYNSFSFTDTSVAGSPTYNFIAEFDEAKLDGSPTVMTIWYQQPPKTTDAYIAAKAAYEAAVTAYADIAAAQDTANAAKAAAQAAVDAETARAAAEAAWTADQGNTDLLAAKISAENAALNKYQAAIKAILTAGEKANAAETSVRKAASEAETAKLEAEEDVTDAEDKGAAAESKRPQAELDLNGKNVLLGTAKGELTAAQGELATAESDLVAAKAAYDPTEPDTVTALATAEAAAQTAKDAVVTAQTNVQNAQTAVQAAQATLDEVLKNIDDAKTELSEALTAQTAAEKLQALLDTTATTGLLVEVAAAKAAAEDANTALGSATNAEGLKEAAAEFAPVDVSSAQKVLDAAAEASRWEIVPLKATVSFNTDGTFDTVSSVTGFPATGTLNANNFRIAPTTSKTSLEIRVAQNLQNAPDISEALTNYNVLSSVSQGAYEQTKLTVYDCQGNAYTMEISFKKVTEDRWRWEAFFPDNPELFDSPPSGELLFGSCGKVVEPLDGVDIYVPFSLLGTQNETIHLDFSNKYFKGEDYVWDTDALEGLTQYAASTTVNAYYQDGYEMGVLNDYTVSPDGTITGIYTNDQTQPIYRVALAQFANPMGLDKVGDTMFRESINSGIAQIGAAEDNGAGKIASGSLEMSNVDLTEEFTRLIIAQRGFQANTRVVTTSDQILEEVVNLKR